MEDSVFDDLDSYSFYAIQWSPGLGNIQDIDWEAMKGYYNNPGFKPVVNYEGQYDHHWAGEFKTRTQGWLAYLNGQFGFGYGAPTFWSILGTVNDINNAKTAMYNDGVESYNRDWFWVQGLYSEGSVVMMNMKDILTQYEWWKLVPVLESSSYSSIITARKKLLTATENLPAWRTVSIRYIGIITRRVFIPSLKQLLLPMEHMMLAQNLGRLTVFLSQNL